MGFFDFLKTKSASSPTGGSDDKTLAKHAERVMDKRGMSPDRFASIEFLCKTGTAESWRAVLPRFNFTVDPTITDREEKQYLYDSIVLHPEESLDAVCELLRTTESLHWPLKILRNISTNERVVSELLKLLENFDTGYARKSERKAELIAALETAHDERITPAILPFLKDFTEDVRFHTVRTLFSQQQNEPSITALIELVVEDDSMRIKTTVVDGFVDQKWTLTPEQAKRVQPMLNSVPTGPWRVSADGVVGRY